MADCPSVNGHCTSRRSGLRSDNRPKSVSADGRIPKDCAALSADDNRVSVPEPTTTPDDSTSSGSAGGPMYDHVLCYVANVRNSSSRSDIFHLVATFFCVETIDKAKRHCGTIALLI